MGSIPIPSFLQHAPVSGNRFSDGDKAAARQFIAQVEAQAASSGLSRNEFFNTLDAQTRNAVSNASLMTSNRPTSTWLDENLPWMVAAPAAVASFLPGSAGAAGSGASASAATGAGAGATTAVPSMPWTIPAGFEASMGAAPLGSAAAGGAGALLQQLTSGRGLAGLAGLATTLATRPNNSGGGSGDLMSQNPQLQHLLDMSANRAERTDPLHQAVTQLAMSRLPTNVQR